MNKKENKKRISKLFQNPNIRARIIIRQFHGNQNLAICLLKLQNSESSHCFEIRLRKNDEKGKLQNDEITLSFIKPILEKVQISIYEFRSQIELARKQMKNKFGINLYHIFFEKEQNEQNKKEN